MQNKLDQLATKIDQASDNSDKDGLENALKEIEEVTANEISSFYSAQLNFFAANCYAGLRNADGNSSSGAWKNSLLEKEIYYLRLSLSACNTVPLNQDQTDLRFRVATNLANALNHVGRFTEAIEIWDEVLGKHPKFAMAIGNRGNCLCWYARHVYDSGHQKILLHNGYKSLQAALSLNLEEHAVPGMIAQLEYIRTLYNWDTFSFEPESKSRGRSELEKKYRTWCLSNRLFLNPLNDLGEIDIAANDVLSFPSIIVSINESLSTPPEVYGIYNKVDPIVQTNICLV